MGELISYQAYNFIPEETLPRLPALLPTSRPLRPSTLRGRRADSGHPIGQVREGGTPGQGEASPRSGTVEGATVQETSKGQRNVPTRLDRTILNLRAFLIIIFIQFFQFTFMSILPTF